MAIHAVYIHKYTYKQLNTMVFQTHKVIILVLVILCLINIVHSYQIQNQTQNYLQIEQIVVIEQIELIQSHLELYKYNILSLVYLLFINQQI